MPKIPMLFYIFQIFSLTILAENLKFEVEESAEVGRVIGWISGKPEQSHTPTFFVVFPDEQISKFLKVDEKSGQISTIAQLDYEKRGKFDFVAVRVEQNAQTTDITVEVVDENDNEPRFADQHVRLKISEFAQLGSSFALPTVTDLDGPNFNVKKFEILQGNVNNVFKISTRAAAEKSDQLQADLVINGQLDREFRDSYELLIEAEDGGKPAKCGQIRVSIDILDANDMAPIFTRTRYSATISPNITIGAKIIEVHAEDGDIAENARVSYEIRKTAAPSNGLFEIDERGWISVRGELLAASTHDLIVVARDHGSPSLSTSSVVTITVLGSSLSAPPLDVIWLVESNSAHLMENSTLGSIVARVSLSPEYRATKLKLIGCQALCPQQTDIAHVYLLLLCGVLDRESQPEYHLKFLLETSDGQIAVEHPILLTIGDVNDNWPSWHSSPIHISLNRSVGGARSLTAQDPDAGQNGFIKYSILDTELVSIDPETGRIFVPKPIDCSIGPELRFRVRAEDNGQPVLFNDLQVVADLLDAESRPPQFQKSLWQVEVAEDLAIGTCLIKVVANNSQCGNSKRIRYSMKDPKLSIDSISGTICLIQKLDYEASKTYQATVTATNSNSESSTSQISITLQDVNDNWPIFYPNEYQLTIREGLLDSNSPLLRVSATDADEAKFGEVAYQILSDSKSFTINTTSGDVFAKKPLTRGKYHLIIGAKDGSGQTSEHPANVYINVIDQETLVPMFSQSRYEIRTTEDILPGIAIGNIAAVSDGKIKYSIYSGDPQKFFAIDENSGKIYVTRYLDADIDDKVLLNIEARLEGSEMSNQTQVLIEIEDHNDNPPMFEADVLEISIREDQEINEPFYMIHAIDKDKKENGKVFYSILAIHPPNNYIEINRNSGQILTSRIFDYEQVRDYKLKLKATDGGIPAKSSNITLFIHILDVNDNPPIFSDSPEILEVVEMSPAKTIIGRIRATDRDSGENGEIKYRVTNGSEFFGVDEKLGDIYTKRPIDREVMGFIDVTVLAEDQGSPRKSSTKNFRINVLDVNDNPPSCHTISPIVVASDSGASSSIGTIVATDPDKGLNGSVLYRAQLQSNIFVVKANGEVYLKRALDSSDSPNQRLSVIVSDQGTPRKSTVCHVSIQISSSSSSSIVLFEPLQKFIEIPESCVLACRLTYFNSSGVHQWQIQSSEISNHFQIRDGVLSMLSNPQHPAPYSLTIIMSDVNGRQKSLMVKLSSSKNRKNQEVIRINERNWAIGSRVGKLGGERDPSVFYYSSNSTWCPLEVDQTSGQLYLAEKIQENIRCSFEKFNTSSGTSVKLDVDLEISRSHRSSYRPKFERDHFIVNVREDVAIGTIIASISVANMSNVEAEDQDGEVAYRFGAASLGEEKFAIDQFTGDVSVVEQLEWHVKSIYHLSIEAFTQKTTSTLLTININDIDNHPPIFISQPTIYVPSILRKGSVIHRVIAKDLDKHPKITYTFKNPSKILKINETSGEISIRTSTSVEKEQTVRVIANSSGKLAEQLISIKYSTKNQSWNYFDEQKLRINSKKFDLPTSSVEHVRLTVVSAEDFELNGLQVSVNQSSRLTILAESENHLDYTVVQADIDNDDEITEIPLLKITSTSCGVLNIPENQAFVNFRRIMVQGTSQNPLKFRFQGGNDAGFRINETSGEMSCGELDRELRQEHLLVVLVEDEQKRRSDSCTVRIIVTDINDNAPQFHPSTPDLLEINRTSNIGDILFNFDATDADIGINGKISFDLLKDESKSLDLIPETGSLVLRRFANLKTWQIVCRVFDQGYPRRLYRDVTIQIVNGAEVEASEKDQDQDQELSFLKQSYLSSVDESLPRGQFVGKIEVIPEDIGITFSIVEGNIDSAFLIDGDGVIRTNLELDKEIVEMYHLKIIGIPVQNSRHQISTRFDIRVNNLNDNLPYFSISNAVKKISESIEVGSYISTVQAKDVDQLEQLQYFLDSEEDAFNIDRFTGTIHLAKGLDFETRSRFDLKIKVTDGEFEAFSNLTLIVLDTNDNPPQFAKPIYSLCTNSLTGIDVSAIDLDSGSALTYTISPNYLAEIPDVSRGFVELKMLPPNGERHILKVVASDGKFRTAVPIVISVGEEKIEKKIRRMNREFEVDESLEPGMIVGELSETPEEQEYRMSNDFFEVDAFGRIYTRRDLRSSMVNFEVTCDDLDLKINVTIKIKPVNLNPPVFTNPIYNIALRDSMQHGQIIGKIQASDKDRDSQLSYHILSGNDLNVITINQQNGNVLFNQWNDETPERIYIEVREASRSSICELLLNLKMSGATAPFFVLPSYDVHVLEGTPINSVIFRVRSSNRLGTSSSGSQKALIYSLKDTKAFSIDVLSGEIRNKIHLDWESEPNYSMLLSVADGNGRSAVVPLKIIVEPVDEFAPIFPVKSYTFQVPLTSQIGDVIGEVRAVDEDAGIHGIVRYSILDKQNTVQVDEKGNILLLKSLSTRKNLTIEKFDILAYSSPEKSSKSTVFLEIGQFPTNPTTNLLHAKTIQIAGFVLLILMLTLIILICVCMCRGRSGGTSKEDQKSAMPSSTSMSLQKQVYSVQTGEIRNLSSDLVIGSSSLKYKYPSKFQESISSSASSEVLRAKSRSQIDSGIMDAEGSVNSSVTDYLVSIGVNGNPIPPRIRTTTTYDSLMNDYIYARVDDVLPPGPINLQTQNQHAMLRQPITTRKPPISIPSFEPLTEIFNELCEQKEYCQVEI